MKNKKRKQLKNPFRPKPGSSIKVEPIRDRKAIAKIKKLCADNPRDLCLFTLGINTAYRAKEILSITVGQVAHLKAGSRLDIRQSKNRKYRATVLNGIVVESIQAWLEEHPDPVRRAPLFISRRGGAALTVSTLNHMVKRWCGEAGLKGNYGSHTLRKTWGYHQRVQNEAPIPLLMEAFGHTSQAQTLDYLCIQAKEIEELYGLEL